MQTFRTWVTLCGVWSLTPWRWWRRPNRRQSTKAKIIQGLYITPSSHDWKCCLHSCLNFSTMSRLYGGVIYSSAITRPSSDLLYFQDFLQKPSTAFLGLVKGDSTSRRSHRTLDDESTTRGRMPGNHCSFSPTTPCFVASHPTSITVRQSELPITAVCKTVGHHFENRHIGGLENSRCAWSRSTVQQSKDLQHEKQGVRDNQG